MDMKAPYGSWPSPISAALLTDSAVALADVVVDGEDLYWSESRPQEDGRTAIVSRNALGDVADITPDGFNSRSRVHEYGGGSYVVREGIVVSCRFEDQRVYRIEDGEAVPITPLPPIPAGDRYADFVFHNDMVICVRERHSDDREPVNTLVVFPLDGSARPAVIAEGHDFFASPRVSPDGSKLAWLSWDHPNMPWDGTELWTADMSIDGMVANAELVAGGVDESIFQPEWSPDATLHFVSDRTGWWNLYRMTDDGPDPLLTMEADFGFPQWGFGMGRYGFIEAGRIAAVYSDRGVDRVGVLDEGTLSPVSTRFDVVRPWLGVSRNTLYVVAGSSVAPLAVVGIDLDANLSEVIRESIDVDIDPAMVSRPTAIEFPTSDDATAHAFYYSPLNPFVTAPEDERPPLLVLSHGGPTGATNSAFNLEIQFWTSRGFAVVDVNYRGSTGYGRSYRNALRGRWGVVDLEDCLSAAQFLVDEGHVDAERLAIRGGSAGGYTTLCALTFSEVFSVGACYYGISDLTTFIGDTHKFESRYVDGLVGTYPEAAAIYEQRSPLQHLDRFDCPVILLQGLDDKVVPPSQSEMVVAVLEERGIPHTYLAFEGEGHGFRGAATIERSLEAELYFFGRVLGFAPADDLEPVTIVHGESL
jgi:dipeptidyl aminopeptidase/acylaminoacyl peptidase